jgi:hypothetical protein
MGDSSELRPLVFVGTFISIMVILFSLTPTQFFIADPTSRQVNVPATWESFLLTSTGNYSKMWDGHVDDGIYATGLYRQEVDDGSGTFGGWEIRIGSSSSFLGVLTCYKQNFWWIIPTGIEPLTFRASNGKDYGLSLDKIEINEVYSQTGKLDFSVSLSYLSFDILISWM